MSKKINAPRGMNDVLPLSAQRREGIIRKLTPIYSKWGFMPIECPAMENIERLIGSDGGDNEKLVFQVLKRGLDADKLNAAEDTAALVDLGLRFDLTVPMARFYASNASELPRVSKFLNYGPVWRAERPQKGRFRQFMQWDADIVGATEGLPEIELMLCSGEALAELGLDGFVMRVNDRRILRALVESVGIPGERADEAFIVIDKLDKVGLDGVEKEMLERGFETSQVTALVAKLAPFLENNTAELTEDIDSALNQLAITIDDDARESISMIFNTVKQQLKGGQLIFDPTLVRGMGYYTGQIFEVSYQDYSFSIAGGGRYDGMIGRFLGRDVPACGFSLGFDRILTIMDDQQRWPDHGMDKKVLFLIPKSLNEENVAPSLALATQLRDQGLDVCVEKQAKNIKNQIAEYQKVGFTHCVTVNDPQNTTVEDLVLREMS